MTTRVFGDKAGFTTGNARPTPPPPPRRRHSPLKVVLLLVLGLAAAFFILKRVGVIDVSF
jgi:hypothetical protein